MKKVSLLLFSVLLCATVFALALGLNWIAQHHGPTIAFAALLSISSLPLVFQGPSLTLGAIGTIGDLWVAPNWIAGLRERCITRPSLLTTGAVVRDKDLQQLVDSGGAELTINHLRDPNNPDEIQVEDTAPTTYGMVKSTQKAPALNRVSVLGQTALSRLADGADPVAGILDGAYDQRLRQRQVTLLSILRGVFGFASASGATTAALYPLRYDAFSETGASPTSDKLIDNAKMLAAIHLLGEEVDAFIAKGGAIVMHSSIALALQLQDQITVVRNSEGKVLFRDWKGVPVFVNDLLRRAGTTSGYVFDTYILSNGSIGFADRAQSAQIGEVASLVLHGDAEKNNLKLFDRNRLALHVYGTKWAGTPAGQTATNAELATVGNWQLGYSEVKLAGAICIRTNG